MTHQHSADTQGAEILLRQAQLPPESNGPDAGTQGPVIGVLVVVLQSRNPDAGIRVATDAANHGVDGLLQPDHVDLVVAGDLEVHVLDVLGQRRDHRAGLAVFLHEVGLVPVGLDAAVEENRLYGQVLATAAGFGQLQLRFRGHLLRIHQHVLAELLELQDLVPAGNAKTLKRKGRTQPRPIQLADEHANLQVFGGDFSGIQHGRVHVCAKVRLFLV